MENGGAFFFGGRNFLYFAKSGRGYCEHCHCCGAKIVEWEKRTAAAGRAIDFLAFL